MGASKKSQKIQGCQRNTIGIPDVFWGPIGGLHAIFKRIKSAENRHLKRGGHTDPNTFGTSPTEALSGAEHFKP